MGMQPFRIALANLRIPQDREDSVALARQAVADAGAAAARIICFPECFVPGYRVAKPAPPADPAFLQAAWSTVAEAAAKADIAVVLGTERVLGQARLLTALVINSDGTLAG